MSSQSNQSDTALSSTLEGNGHTHDTARGRRTPSDLTREPSPRT